MGTNDIGRFFRKRGLVEEGDYGMIPDPYAFIYNLSREGLDVLII
jgi:hypothetical protein